MKRFFHSLNRKELFDHLAERKASSGLNLPIIVDPHPNNFVSYHGITLAKPNRAEAEWASGIVINDKASSVRAAQILRERWMSEMMMITLGKDGLVIVNDDHPDGIYLETVARKVYDVSGAGDAVTAVFAAVFAKTKDVQLAGELSNVAGGIVVSEVGTAPIDIQKLRSYLLEEK